MSGQFPHHQPGGGAPVTMNNYSGWNQPHQQPQGRDASPGTPQNIVHGMTPPPHMQSPTQVSGSPPKGMKFSNMPINGGGGHVSPGVINQNSPSNLSDNLRHNFQMYMNQGHQSPKCSNVNSSVSPSALSDSIDLSRSPRTAAKEQSNLVSDLAVQSNKEFLMPKQNHSVIAKVGISAPFNGAAVSVIANAPTSPSKKAGSQNLVTNANQGDSKVGVGLNDRSPIKRECESANEAIVSPGKDSPISFINTEPPLKRIKEEEGVKCVNSSVIVGSSIASSNIQNAGAQQNNVTSQGTPPSNQQPSSLVSDVPCKQDALDVESQLEALFAGIGDDGTSKDPKSLQDSSTTESTPNIVAVLESKGTSGKKGKGKTNGVCGTSSTESTPKKKRKKRPAKPWEDSKNKKSKKGGQVKGKYLKDASCDSGSNASSSRVRGPLVHLEGTKEAPTSLAVVNAPSRQDDEDNDNKKKTSTSGRIRKIHSVEGKMSSTGLCGNSLVARYEAHSSDPRWVCVFCKKGCHVDGLGDLFGPYLINHDTELENSLDLDADMDRKKDKKNKRSGIGQTGVLGLLAIPPLAGEQPQFMVYFHELCAVWTPSINLIGSRLAGVQEAVWVAVRSKCSRCSMDGANIGCVHHGCFQQVHFPCGREANWSLDVDTFISTCQIHKKPEQIALLPTSSTL